MMISLFFFLLYSKMEYNIQCTWTNFSTFLKLPLEPDTCQSLQLLRNPIMEAQLMAMKQRDSMVV